jgi:hypothetical protein
MIQHNLYILNGTSFNNNNKSLLIYIKQINHILRDMEVNLTIIPLDIDQITEDVDELLERKNIKNFPILITPNKIYDGMANIIEIYENNINEYKKYKLLELYQIEEKERQRQIMIQQQLMQKQQLLKQQQMMNNRTTKKKTDDSENDDDNDNLKNYMNRQIGSTNSSSKKEDSDVEDNEMLFDGTRTDMMDMYRTMMEKRGTSGSKNLRDSKLRIVETNSFSVKKNNSNENKEDNIEQTEAETINIDPSSIEKDPDDDPQDYILEQAYWSRISETKD